MVAIVSRSSCLGCSNSFEPRDGKLYCSEACRRKSERKRARLRRQEPPRPPRPRLPLGVCRDCGTTDDMYWWQAKPGYSKSGTSRSVPVTSAATRCRACYNEYCRRRYHAKRYGQIVGRMHGPPKPQVRWRTCPGCGVIHHYGSGERCAECAHQHRMAISKKAQARRLDVERRGDKDIHWSTLGERDGWTCHLCSKPVKQQAGTAHVPLGATVDHLLPIAAGGEHVWANVALAHRKCNTSRGAGGIAQLRLVG